MTNSKYSNDLRAAIGWTDIKKREEAVEALLEQTRTNTIEAAIAALPERRVLPGINEEWLEAWMHMMGGTSEFNRAIDQAKANILKLKEG